MQIGDRWIYEEEIRDGNRQHPDVDRWKQQDTTFAIETIPEGILVRRKVQLLDNTAPPEYMGSGPESNILIQNNCIYYLNDSASGWGWDSSRNQLSGDFRKALASKEALPDVCFPLHTGETWGDPNKGRDLWTVTGLGRKNPDDPSSVTPEAWRLEGHLSSGDDNYVWFQKGVGVIARRTYHNGSYHDDEVRLVHFQPRM
jgi:hypothetical protein